MGTDSTPAVISETEVAEILAGATDRQIKFVFARLMADTDTEAAAKLKVRPEALSRWTNKRDLDQVVNFYRVRGSMAALEMLSRELVPLSSELLEIAKTPDPVGAVSWATKLRAITAILDRAGLPAGTKMDLQGDLRTQSGVFAYIPDNKRDPVHGPPIKELPEG